MSRVFVSAGILEPGGKQIRYDAYLARLRRTVEAYWDGPGMWFTDYPPESPDHNTVNYAFKLYALKEAVRRGHTTLLWSDACVIARSTLDPVFHAIERDGYMLVTDAHRLRQWASDAILAWAGITDRDALGPTTIAAGGFVGLNLLHPLGRTLWTEWWDAYRRGFTQTYWREHQKPENSAKSVAMHFGVHLSDRPDVLGSLGEEAMWGALCVKYGLERNGGLFCAQSPTTVFQSTGYDEGSLGAL